MIHGEVTKFTEVGSFVVQNANATLAGAESLTYVGTGVINPSFYIELNSR